MIFVKNSTGGREVNMINTVSKINLSKINLSKIGWEGGGSTLIWIMSLNILTAPLNNVICDASKNPCIVPAKLGFNRCYVLANCGGFAKVACNQTCRVSRSMGRT